MIKVLIPDAIHIHKKGFPNILELINTKKIEAIFMGEHDDLKILYGNYENKKTIFLEEYDELKKLSFDELFNKKISGISLFKLVQAEMLSYLMSKQNWFNSELSSNEKEIFSKAYLEDKETLLLNLAVSIWWIKFWKRRLSFNNYKTVNNCIMFSGSLIYLKTLTALLENTQIKVFVLEHLFTGHHFYLEEKYTHIANNSDIQFNNIFNTYKKEFEEENYFTFEREKLKTINHFRSKKNKNVIQPLSVSEASDFFNFDKDTETILIMGQVINDFSILETLLDNINSLDTYKKIILNILNTTNYNIIFKAHPWEKNKINLKKSLTKDALIDFVNNNFKEKEQNRIVIVEDFNLDDLIEFSEHIVGICSQSLLECAYLGRKVHQLGKSFFGNKGFTYDYNTINEFIEALSSPLPHNNLSLKEYNDYLLFITILFQKHTVSIFPSGERRILDRLTMRTSIGLLNKSKAKLSPSFKRIKEDSTEEIFVNQNITLSQHAIESLIFLFSNNKKKKKFKKNPKIFFKDSKHFVIKILGKLY